MSGIFRTVVAFVMLSGVTALAEGHGSGGAPTDSSRPTAERSSSRTDSRSQLSVASGDVSEGSLSDFESSIQGQLADFAGILESLSK